MFFFYFQLTNSTLSVTVSFLDSLRTVFSCQKKTENYFLKTIYYLCNIKKSVKKQI